MLRKLSILIGLGAMAIIGIAGSATAQDAKPAPAGCFGALMEDGTGDAGLQGIPAPLLGDNMDIKGGWFRWITGKDGKPQLVADVHVANLDTAVTPGWNAHTWWVRYMVGETTHFVVAQLNSDGSWAWHQGTDASDGYSIEGATTGRVFEGADGIIEIDIKQRVAGKTLSSAHITSRPAMTQGGQPILSPSSDRAPDSGGADDWEANPCDPPAAPTGPDAPAPAALDVTARKAKLAGKTVKVALSGNASKLTGKLMKGSKTVAKGKLPKLAGKATMKLKGSKKLKKGSYTLALTGTNGDGAAARKSLPVKAR